MRKMTCIGEQEGIALLEAAVEELRAIGKPAVVAVADLHGERISFIRMDGAPLPSTAIAQAKAFTAARLGQTTRSLASEIREEGASIYYFGDSKYVGWAGGIPIVIRGALAGGIGVSGLSEDDDELVAERAVRRALNSSSQHA